MIPSKMRDSLSSKLYVMKGFDGCIEVYNESKFQEMVQKLEQLAFTKKDVRIYVRAKLGSTYELDVDKLGRIQIVK